MCSAKNSEKSSYKFYDKTMSFHIYEETMEHNANRIFYRLII